VEGALVGVDEGVDDGVGDGAGADEEAAGGVALTRATVAVLAIVDAGADRARSALPCPVANWLTTNAMTSTLIPSPTPIEALPMVCSADRSSGVSRIRPRPVPRSLPGTVPSSLQRAAKR
jgi:hypothetical protein